MAKRLFDCECGKLVVPGRFFCEECELKDQLSPEFTYARKALFPSIDQILENLYLGNEDAALTKELLEERKISHILVAGDYLEKAFPNDYVYLTLPIDDSAKKDIKQFFEKAIIFIDSAIKQDKNVLVHCAAGISRSATITIAYLMISQSWTFNEAYDYVKAKRPIICPNVGFVKQLKEFDVELNKKSSKKEEDDSQTRTYSLNYENV